MRLSASRPEPFAHQHRPASAFWLGALCPMGTAFKSGLPYPTELRKEWADPGIKNGLRKQTAD